MAPSSQEWPVEAQGRPLPPRLIGEEPLCEQTPAGPHKPKPDI